MYKQLSREQRYAIYLGIQEGKSQKAIARQNNIHPSTVSREVRRNSTKRGEYQWQHAQKLSDERRERLPGNHAVRPDVMQEALRLLVSEDWSPKQISGWLSHKGMTVSHETIYRRIRADVSGELVSHCRHRMKYRHHVKRPRTTKVRNIPQRGLGDGLDCWQGAKGRHTYFMRAERKLHDDGEAAARKEAGGGCRGSDKDADAV